MKTINYLSDYKRLYLKEWKYVPLAFIGLPILVLILIDGIISDIFSVLGKIFSFLWHMIT
jgi:hypothetical protein